MAPEEDRRALLVRDARRFSLDLPPAAADLMLAYLDAVLEANKSVNLTAIRDPAEAVGRHLADSLAFALHAAEAGVPRRLVDVGSGGGFPGVPIAIAWPATDVLLVEATRKKVHAVEQILAGLGIAGVRAHWGRAEDLHDLPPADAVTARAVGALAETIRRTHHLLAPGGTLVSWKSDEVSEEERDDGARAAARAGMESLPDLEYQLGARRRLVRFRRQQRGAR